MHDAPLKHFIQPTEVQLEAAQERHRFIFERFMDLARDMLAETPNGPERSAGFRKLIEARDCFIRATLC